ncbi:MAG: aspartate--tRNA ligase, partial [Lentisphaeria bacterium]|nr:aspartate--tRNA ligase [Lentisphaeria bacterium]
MHRYRSHNCNELRKENIGGEARLAGWIHTIRDHGGVMFVDLRDHYGLTQVVLNPADLPGLDVHTLSNESVIRVDGLVVARDEDTYNDRIPTGEVELKGTSVEMLSHADTLPMVVNTDEQISERLRLTYRFLDLRRRKLHDNILLRSRVINHIRQQLTADGFTEFQTPILTASSPEGA